MRKCLVIGALLSALTTPTFAMDVPKCNDDGVKNTLLGALRKNGMLTENMLGFSINWQATITNVTTESVLKTGNGYICSAKVGLEPADDESVKSITSLIKLGIVNESAFEIDMVLPKQVQYKVQMIDDGTNYMVYTNNRW